MQRRDKFLRRIEILNQFQAIIEDSEIVDYRKSALYQDIKKKLISIHSVSNFSTKVIEYNKQLIALGLDSIPLPNDLTTLDSDSSLSKTQNTNSSFIKKSSSQSANDSINLSKKSKSSSQETSQSNTKLDSNILPEYAELFEKIDGDYTGCLIAEEIILKSNKEEDENIELTAKLNNLINIDSNPTSEESEISKFELINFFGKNAYTNDPFYYEVEKATKKGNEYDNSVSSPPSQNSLNKLN